MGRTDNAPGVGPAGAVDPVSVHLETPRQRAIVLMTDGVDNALTFHRGFGSKTLFADLLETVRRSGTTIIPIYLDTEEGSDELSQRVYRDARNTLGILASESGGILYKANVIDDLNGVYGQVLNDLSRTYVVGYLPENDRKGGEWRAIQVKVPGRPDLLVKTKSGYYAR